MSAADDEIGRFTEYSVHHQMIYSITKRPRPGDEGHGLEQPPHSWRAYRVGADLLHFEAARPYFRPSNWLRDIATPLWLICGRRDREACCCVRHTIIRLMDSGMGLL